MNTKGMKFLAVLAVLAMAFTIIAVGTEEADAVVAATVTYSDGTNTVNDTEGTATDDSETFEVKEFDDASLSTLVAPDDMSFVKWAIQGTTTYYNPGDSLVILAADAGTPVVLVAQFALAPVNVWDDDDGSYAMDINPKKISTGVEASYYFDENTSVKILDMGANLHFYVNQGVTVDVKITDSTPAGTVTFLTVSGDKANKKIADGSNIKMNGAEGIYQYTALSTDAYGTVKSGSTAKFYASVTVAGFEAGGKTAVAAGTTLVADDAGSIKFGVMYVDEDGNSVMSAPGDKVSDIKLGTTTDSVTVKKGTVKILNGTAYVDIVGVSDATLTATYTANSITLSGGTGTAGSITLNSSSDVTIYLGDGGAFTNGTNMTVTKKSTVTATSVVNDGVLTLKNSTGIDNGAGTGVITGSGTLIAANKDLWVAFTDDPTHPSFGHMTIKGVAYDDAEDYTTIQYEGKIDTSSISEPLNVSSGVFSNITVYENQVVTVIGDASVQGSLVVYGIMNINSGVKFTVEVSKNVASATMAASGPFAIVTNNGAISIVSITTDNDTVAAAYCALIVTNNATFVNDGTITTSTKSPSTGQYNGSAIAISSNKFTNNGTITIGSNDIVAFGDGETWAYNAGTMAVNGTIAGAITNAGTITFSGASLATPLAIDLAKKDAVVDVKKLKIAAQDADTPEANFTIINRAFDASSSSPGNESIAFAGAFAGYAAGDTVTIKGIQVTAGTMYGDDGKLTETMVISGSLTLECSNSATQIGNNAYALFTLSGDFVVDGTFNIPARASFTGGNFVVNGILTALPTDAAPSFAPTTMDVNGRVTGAGVKTFAGNENGRFASYTTETGATIYTTLENAISEAAAAELTVVDVSSKGAGLGYVIGADLIIPAGMVIDGTGEYLIINGKVAVESTAVFTFQQINVYGSLYAPDKNNISATNVYSDVVIEGDDDILYLTFADAAKIGGKMRLNGSNGITYITSDVEVPAGVVMDFSEDNDGKTLEVVGCTLTITGKLIMHDDGVNAADGYGNTPVLGFEVYDSHTAEASVIVNGFLQTLEGADASNKWWYPDGVHYTATIDDETYTITTSIANIETAIAQADEKEIEITARNAIGDFTIAGTSAEPVTATISTDLDAGTITLSNAELDFVVGNTVTATIKNASGEIFIKDARITAAGLEFVEDGTLTMSGGLDDLEDADNDVAYILMFSGETAIDGFVAGMSGDYTDDSIVSPTVVVNGTLTAQSKTNEFAPIVYIYGTFVADNLSSVEFNMVNVIGSLIAKEKTSTAMAGSVDAYVIFVGTDYYGVYSKALSPLGYAVAGTAVLSGNISAETYIYAAPGAQIEDAIIEDLKSLSMQVDGIEYLAVYTNLSYVPAHGMMVPSQDAVAIKFLDKYGEQIVTISTYKVDGTAGVDKTFEICAKEVEGKFGYSLKDRAFFGSYEDTGMYYIGLNATSDGAVVNAVLDYEIYTVQIKTDASIKAVYLDGSLMYNTTDNNYFTLGGITAGVHTVTVEAAAGWDASHVALYTEDGTILKDLSFVFDEYDLKEGQTTVVYNLAGTEEIVPEPITPEEQSEWTITTILLVILVILIAIMAVIVAIRLNRS